MRYIYGRISDSFPPGYKILAAKKVEGKEIDLTKLDRAVYTVELEYEGSQKSHLPTTAVQTS